MTKANETKDQTKQAQDAPAAEAPQAAPAAKAEPEAAAQKETVKFPAFIEENPVFMIQATLDCAAAALCGMGAAIRENGKEREPAPEDVLAVGFKDGVAVIVTVDGQKFTIKADTGDVE